MSETARAEYESRLGTWRGVEDDQNRKFVQIGNYRLAVFLIAAALAYLAFFRGAIAGWWMLLPGAVFIVLVVIHERVSRRKDFAGRAIRFYDRGIARLEGRWMGSGSDGERFRDPSHLYADDLDVFGRGSLFELLSAARTGSGESTLASWLKHPAPIEEVKLRQAAVAELRTKLDLRETLALLGENIRAGVHESELAAWGAAPPIPFSPYAPVLAFGIGAVSAGAFAGWMMQLNGWGSVLLGSIAVALAMGYRYRHFVAHVEHGLDTPSHDLRILFLLLERLEKETFESAKLRSLRARLDSHGHAPSHEMKRLFRLLEWMESSDNVFVRVAAPALLYREQLAFGIEEWRQQNGPAIARWLEAVGEFEALSSLAAYAFEQRDTAVPELAAEASPVYEGVDVRHPLLAEAVPNSIELRADMPLLLVSGSNMSGKSTLLRATGLNNVLAWAGSVVPAARLRVSPLRTGASLRNVDSLQDGKSRFYAEITRLRQILDLARAGHPALFLLDELLSGTNSHDRRIGAEGVIRGLLDAGAIGLVTTHDLALTAIDDARKRNVHFEDHMENGEMRFDYRLRDGVVRRSNALELMRAVGLNV
ncbi:MAG: hypothetical protein K2X35_17495 [Bryobacteraceae bacterium]|nr:hypothetical protein [Bryobacteraceae bacterium]